MKNFIRKAAKKLGWKTEYHVSYEYIGKDTDRRTCENVFEVTPWLNSDTVKELNEYLDNQIKDRQTLVIITSITKLGI